MIVAFLCFPFLFHFDGNENIVKFLLAIFSTSFSFLSSQWKLEEIHLTCYTEISSSFFIIIAYYKRETRKCGFAFKILISCLRSLADQYSNTLSSSYFTRFFNLLKSCIRRQQTTKYLFKNKNYPRRFILSLKIQFKERRRKKIARKLKFFH